MDTSNDIQNTIISDSSNEADLESAIFLQRQGLRIVGLWPEKDESKTARLFSKFRLYVSFLLILLFLVISPVWSLVRVWGDIMLVIDNLAVTLAMVSTTVKCCILWWKKDALLPVITAITEDWLKIKRAEERAAMIKQARFSRKIAMFGFTLTTIILIILNVPPFFGYTIRYTTNFTDPGKRPLPAQSYFTYDITKKSNYMITYICQAISFFFMGIYYTGVDCFFALLVLHVCGQLENLKMHFTNLGSFKDFREEFSFCVQEHVRIIRLVGIVDNAVNLMLLLQLLIFTILFCFQGFLLIKLLKENSDLKISRFVWLVGTTFNILAHMFLYCFVGETLVLRLIDGMLKCEEIYEAAYNSSWYTLEPKKARMLLIILIRTRSPLYITAGKMFPMTMAMFCGVIKTSVSYISVLLAYS